MNKNRLGGLMIAGQVAMNLLLWLLYPPQDDGRENFRNQMIGEMVSTSALMLMAFSIFLSTRPRFMEPFFGGLDKMYRAHRINAIIVSVLLLTHFFIMAILNQRFHLDPSLAKVAFIGLQASILLAIWPRLPVIGKTLRLAYHHWKLIHRITGVFFIVGILHSLRIENVMQLSRPVYFYVLGIAFSGAALYLYKEIMEPVLKKGRAYQVEAIRRLPGPAAQITLAPRNSRIDYRSGQFLLVRFPRTIGLGEQHPFSISSAPGEDRLRMTIKASGDFTRRLVEHLMEGAEARIEGGYGGFDYRNGAPRQVWVAGGIGLTPFLSWIRDFDTQPGREIHFYYSVRNEEEALFVEEIEQAKLRKPGFFFHLHCSNSDGRLNAAKITASSGPIPGKDVFLCGPPPMVAALKKQLVESGVPTRQIHYEEFSFR